MSSTSRTPPSPASLELPPLPPRPNISQTQSKPTRESGDQPHEESEPSGDLRGQNDDPSDHPIESSDPSDRLIDDSDGLSDVRDRPFDTCDRLLEPSDKPKSKRPLSYPWGPDSKPESHAVEFKLSSSHSEPLKPPLTRGKSQVKPFTRESLERLEKKTVQLVREYGFTPRKKLSVEDGSRLPAKYEPFPPNLYGRPLEEIDNFIYDEVMFTSDKYDKYNKFNVFNECDK
ncbi:hypothetical protein WA026_002160 [Henosepilachna vigintioctopunctata]|uniref:Uncharacterized protein n=1 Tax=Henosepilachna vigintioctopunctata TaxID=420089 RepID=A0AAW1TSR1_9CUCU